MESLAILGILVFLSSSLLLTEASQEYNYIADEDELDSIPGEFFPFCVEVSSVWPLPNSVLKPTYIQSKDANRGRLYYLFRVGFSRPVSISNNDTSAGWQPEIVKIPVKGKWLQPKHNSVARAIKEGKYNLKKVAPIFLSPSQTFVKQRYYASRIVSWQGSSKDFLIYFNVPAESRGPNLTLSKKVYLIIDGGRFYSLGKVRSASHPFFAQTTIIGEYYVEEYLKRNSQFKPNSPVPFKPSPYCEQRKPRPFFSNEEVDEYHNSFTAWLNDGSHTVTTNQEPLSVNLSFSVRGIGGTFSLRLPSVIKALYGGLNVSVALPDPVSITIKQPLKAPKLFVPVKRVPIYELRERIYHSGIKLMMPGMPPAFAYTSFTESERDIAEGLFPKKILKLDKLTNINVEMVEMSAGVKLAQHFPFWEWFRNGFKAYRLPKMQWLEMSRNAPIAARSTLSRYRNVYYGIKKWIETNYKFLANNSRPCSADSNRHLAGRRGATIDHVVEHGPLYHLLEPFHPSSWSVESKGTDITTSNDKGTKIPVSVSSPYPGVDSSIPSSIFEGIQNYRCLLPPIKDIPKPTHSHTVNEKWVHLDRCIFVPTPVAESKQCGGLKLFQNLSTIFNSSDFCDQQFGDCIGLLFSPLQRFPVIPTFGLLELTGWTSCPSTQCPLNTHQQHPTGRYSVDGEKFKAVPKSILKFSKTQETPPNSNDDLVMEFNPTLTAESRIDYIVTLSGVKVLEPSLSAQPIDSQEPLPLSSVDCDTVWHFHTTPLNVSKVHPQRREASLTAILHNHGQGGRNFQFGVRCTNHLIVHPEDGVITLWIEPMNSTHVTFLLYGDLASSAPSKKHKCELAIRPEGTDEAVLECTRWFTTYYGAFESPCHLEASVPMIDLAYYVLPASQYESPSLKHFLDSPIADTLQFVKAITVSLLVPPEQENMLKVLSKMAVSCRSDGVVPLLERQLLQEAVRSAANTSYNMDQKVSINGDFTEPRKVFFFATRSWIESQSTLRPLTSSCEVLLTAFRPNWVCRRDREVVRRIHVPLVKADIEAILHSGPFSLLYPLYGRQSDLVMMVLCLCVGTGLLSTLVLLVGCAVLCVNHSRLPRQRTLDRLREDLDKAKREDKKYWENPLVYLCSGDATDNQDSCECHGEAHQGPHFILHQWRATDGLNRKDIRHLKIAGTLKYKTQELPVMFGHVKKVYIHKAKDNANVWVQASSGMYLLPASTVSLEYIPTFVEFCKSHDREESSYLQLLTKTSDMKVQQGSDGGKAKGEGGELKLADEEGPRDREEARMTRDLIDRDRVGGAGIGGVNSGFETADSWDENAPLL